MLDLVLYLLAGQDTLLSCPSCGYSANEERAQSIIFHLSQVDSVSFHRNQEWVNFSFDQFLTGKKCQFFTGKINQHPTIIIIPQNYKLNELKVKQIKGTFESLDLKQFFESFKPSETQFLIDNQAGDFDMTALHGLDWIKNDFILAREGDLCYKCVQKGESSHLVAKKAIEIGHTFYLSTKYSKPLNAKFKDSAGSACFIEMGCFGLGVSRMMAAIVETSHDEHGIIWPVSIAPYKICIIIDLPKKENDSFKMKEMCDILSNEVSKEFGQDEIVIDDRNISIGSKLNDALLIGYPKTIVIGKKYLSEGLIEIKDRRNNKSEFMNPMSFNVKERSF